MSVPTSGMPELALFHTFSHILRFHNLSYAIFPCVLMALALRLPRLSEICDMQDRLGRDLGFLGIAEGAVDVSHAVDLLVAVQMAVPVKVPG